MMSNPHDENRPLKPSGDRDQRAKKQDLHATEDSIRVDLARMAAIEATKTTLKPTDAEVDQLSDEAVDLADGIARKTRAERELGQQLR
jgi:hypothetical protein